MKIVFAAVLFVSTLVFAQTQQEPENSSVPMTSEELALLKSELSNEVAVNPDYACTLSLIEGKPASRLLKVKQDYNEYIELEGSSLDWVKASGKCNFDNSYFEIIVNADKNKKSYYRMRHLSYIYTSSFKTKFNFRSIQLSEDSMSRFIAQLRKVAPVKTIDMGQIEGKASFLKLTVKPQGGDEMVLASVENRLAERALECKTGSGSAEETLCEELSFSVQLSWQYNQFVSFNVSEGAEGSKIDAGYLSIVSVEKNQIRKIKDIRDLFPEATLLAALKKDWIIRNSNRWTKFSQAASWDQFWSFTDKQYYGPVSDFQSYSSKLNAQQVSKVMKCAALAEKNTKINSGFACVNSKEGPRMFMFNYGVFSSTLQNSFSVSKLDEKAVYVQIPLYSDSTGGAKLQLALPRRPSDYFKSSF